MCKILLIALMSLVMVGADAVPARSELGAVVPLVGTICDTADQAAEVGLLLATMAPAPAMAIVNARAGDPHACVPIAALIVKAETVRTVALPNGGVIEVVAVDIAAVLSKGQRWQLIEPKTYYGAKRTAQSAI